MSGPPRPWRVAVVLGCLLFIVGAQACAGGAGGNMNHNTTTGGAPSRTEAEATPISRQFALVGERSARMEALLTDAQLQISDEPWRWLHKGGAPIPGPNAWSERGMGVDNSYHLALGRAIWPEGATGDVADLEPMTAYFRDRGWPVRVRELEGTWHEASADTGDGFIVSWRVQRNGQYNLIVDSVSYWGDARLLLREISGRIPEEAYAVEESPPGEFVPFPSLDDPIVFTPGQRTREEGGE